MSSINHKQQKHTVKTAWFWHEIKSRWVTYSEVLVISGLINILSLILPLFIMTVYNRVIPHLVLTTLWVLALAVTVAIVFDFMLRLLRTYFLDHAAARIDNKLSAKIFCQLLGMSMSARPMDVGVLSNSVQAYEVFREFMTATTITIFIDFPFVIFFIALIAIIAGPLVWVPVVFVPLVLLLALLVQGPAARLLKQSFAVGARKQTILIDSLSSIVMIKCNNAQAQLQQQLQALTAQQITISGKQRFLAAIAVNFAIFMQYFSSVVVMVWGVYLFAGQRISIGALVAAVILTARALSPITQMASLLLRYYQSVAGIKQLSSLMQLPVEHSEQKTYVAIEQFAGDIEFVNVNFSYPRSERQVLQNFNCKIAAGEHVAIIGRVGSGKSTIQKILTALYPVSAGQTLIDGHEISAYDPSELRRYIGYVPQDIMLMPGSLFDAVTLGRQGVSEEQVMQALAIVGLDELIKNHPKGLGMSIGERGQYLSGGQRQALVIAQALIMQPAMLLLDEPTTAMDDVSEHRFKLALAERLPGKTLILITHKGSLLSLVDRVIVMDHGKIVADGPRDQIIAAIQAKQAKQ